MHVEKNLIIMMIKQLKACLLNPIPLFENFMQQRNFPACFFSGLSRDLMDRACDYPGMINFRCSFLLHPLFSGHILMDTMISLV